ncbi:MAG: hypothetical protein V4695_07755 [Pseudomonadota bacterium]
MSGKLLISQLSQDNASFKNHLFQVLENLHILPEQAHFEAVRDLSNVFVELPLTRRMQAFDELVKSQNTLSHARQTQLHAEIAVLLAPQLRGKNQEIVSSTLYEIFTAVPVEQKVQAQVRLLMAITTLPAGVARQLAVSDGVQFCRDVSEPLIQAKVIRALKDAVPSLHGANAQLCGYCDIVLALSRDMPDMERKTLLNAIERCLSEMSAAPGSAFHQDIQNLRSTITMFQQSRAAREKPALTQPPLAPQSSIVGALASAMSGPEKLLHKSISANTIQAVKTCSSIDEKQARYAEFLGQIFHEPSFLRKISLDALAGQSSYAGPVESNAVSGVSARLLIYMSQKTPDNQPVLLKWLANAVATGTIAPCEKVSLLDYMDHVASERPVPERNAYLKLSAGNLDIVLSGASEINRRRLKSLISRVRAFPDSERDNAMKNLSDGFRIKIDQLRMAMDDKTDTQACADALQGAFAFSGEFPESIWHPLLIDLVSLINRLPPVYRDEARKNVLPYL